MSDVLIQPTPSRVPPTEHFIGVLELSKDGTASGYVSLPICRVRWTCTVRLQLTIGLVRQRPYLMIDSQKRTRDISSEG
jgi:hypothetical protein